METLKTKEFKIIYVSIYRPDKSCFKTSKREKAKCKIIECCNSENCGLYKRSQCSWINAFSWQACPYGKFHEEESPSRNTKGYSKWVSERETIYKDVRFDFKSYSDILTIVGEYIFLPYSHMTNNENIPFLGRGGVFMKENCFLPMNSFTVNNIINICEFKPYAMMGGEIKSYQEKQIPKFLTHLSEIMPDIFAELCKNYDRANEIVKNYSYVGRKALLNTLNSKIGKFIDIHGGEWVWDGKYLVSYNSKAIFMITGEFSELRLKPNENCIVTISDNLQVNENTKFLS